MLHRYAAGVYTFRVQRLLFPEPLPGLGNFQPLYKENVTATVTHWRAVEAGYSEAFETGRLL